jgi:hypothetical protein
MKVIDMMMPDAEHSVGIGKVELSKQDLAHTVAIDMSLLKKAIKTLETMGYQDTIFITVASPKDYLLIRPYKDSISGVMIGPRVD